MEKAGRASRPGCKPDHEQRRKGRIGEGGGDSVLDGCVFLGRFGKAVRESLSRNLPSQGHVSPRNGSVYLPVTPP